MSIPLLCQLFLQFLVPALVVASDGDDNDEHEDQQPPGHSPHDDHQHVLHDLGLRMTFCNMESLDISIFWGAFRRCYSDKSKCGTMTALSSTCHTNLHFCIPHSHVILRHAFVGASVRHAEGSPESQGPIRVGGDTFRQLSTHSANRTTQSFITTNPSILKSR